MSQMKVIDTSEFVVSEQSNYNIINYNYTPIVEIDNFIENFSEFRDFVLSIPVERNVSAGFEVNHEHGFAPGYHTTLSYRFDNISKKIFDIISNVYQDNRVEEIKYQTNIFDTSNKCPYSTVQPHMDPCAYAFNLWFNDEEDCKGGTGFCIHKESDSHYLNPSLDIVKSARIMSDMKAPFEQFKFKKADFDYSEIDDSIWEIKMISEMKTNRLVIYPAACFHFVYTKKEWFSKKTRNSLAGFII